VTRILAIDPGPTQSAWLVLDHGMPASWDKQPNAELAARLRAGHGELPYAVVIERVRSYGMPVGAEVLETAEWCGRLVEAAWPTPAAWLTRKEVVLHLCGSPRGNDATVRAALIDRFGGKDAAIGRKAHPGPLHGIHGDCWSALALAVTFADQEALR
jgi:hypothetical protein